MRFDLELDYHGYTVRQMLEDLERRRGQPGWRSLNRVLVIHGTGERLGAALRKWCEQKQIAWSPEHFNPGAVVLHPRLGAASPPGDRRTGRRKRRIGARFDDSTITGRGAPSQGDQQLFEQELERLSRRSSANLRRRKTET